MKYDVAVSPGMYDISLRLATPLTGKTLKLFMDDKLFATMELPSTGNYNKWQTTMLKAVKVPAGKVLKLESVGEEKEEFDFNWIQFTPAK